MKNTTLNQKLGSMTAVLWAGLLVIGLLGAWQQRDTMMTDRRAELVVLMDEAISIVNDYYARAQQHALTEEEAKKQALAALSKLRYGKDGYFTVLNSEMIMLMQPIKPELVGRNFSNVTDAAGNHLSVDIVAAANKDESGGFSSYVWPKPGSVKPIEKTSYQRRFKPWDFYLSTGVYIDDIDNAFVDAALRWAALTIILCGVATLVMMLILRSVRRDLGGSLELAIATAQGIARGDLTNRVHVHSNDKKTSLMHALSTMQASLISAVSQVRYGAETIDAGASEIAAGNTDLSARTEQQAASLQETAASMTEITETVKQNASNALQANSLASNATEITDAGHRAMKDLIDTIGRISTSSHTISDITGVIEGIAFQTNILALNAAVEAARAGEHGRGFAVVASEVRTLAQRAATAAREIKALIEESAMLVTEGSNRADTVGATMERVKRAIKQTAEIIKEIANASAEQSRGIEQINQAVSQMDSVTQQNAALVEQAAAAAQSLEQQAAHLKKTVSMFKLADASTVSVSS